MSLVEVSLVEVRNELVDRLAKLEGLRVYSVPPEAAPELPAAIVQSGQPLAEYGRTLSGGDVAYNFAVLLLNGSAYPAQAWEELAGYLSPTAPGSLKAAVEGGTGGGVDWFRVSQATDGGIITYGKAGYRGVTFHVQAYVSE